MRKECSGIVESLVLCAEEYLAIGNDQSKPMQIGRARAKLLEAIADAKKAVLRDVEGTPA